MKINEGKILLLLTGILSGIVISSFLIGTSQTPTRIVTYSEFQKSSMQVNELRNEINRLTKTHKEIQKKLQQYSDNSKGNKDIIITMSKEYKEISDFYGAGKVNGQGLIITINDREKPNYSNIYDLMASITHNRDLYLLVNELKNAGAKAISINSNRITSKTAITCEGLVIGINKELVTPPYEITVIGDPVMLQYSLSSVESIYQELKLRKLKTSIVRDNNLQIEGYR